MKSSSLIIAIFLCGRIFGQIEELKSENAETNSREVKKDETFSFVDEEASFPGGFDSLASYIQQNLNYPTVAIEENLQGKCFVKFVVTKNGEIKNVTVVRGVPNCSECDEEAKRVIANMPVWNPGKVDKVAVNSFYMIPINYVLPVEEEKKVKNEK